MVFLGVGMWHPDPKTLSVVRNFIVDNPVAWKRARDNNTFRKHFSLGGESLSRPPRGYDKDHPHIEDLKRKDFIAAKEMTHQFLYDGNVVKEVLVAFKAATPFIRFSCEATDAPF